MPGKSHGQRTLAGYSPWGRKESDMTERLHFHFLFYSPSSVPSRAGIVIINVKRLQEHCQLLKWRRWARCKQTVGHCLGPWHLSIYPSSPDSHSFCATSSSYEGQEKSSGDGQTCHSRNLSNDSFFLLSKIGIIIFSVSTFIVQVLSYFTTSKENALAYFIDDFMMAGPG